MRRIALFLIFALSLCMPILHGQTAIFVSTAGSDDNNGATWATAKATLAGALSAATNTTHIYMKVGTYFCQNVTIPNGVTVTGGYKPASTGTDTTQRLFLGTNANWSNANLCTILDGNNTSRVATVNSGGKLEGCVIQRGKVTGNGGGVLVNGGTVLHCIIIHNSALDETNLSAKGGGAYVQNNGDILNCVIAYNYANNGPAVAGTDGTLTNNTITANYTMANCGTVNDIDGNTYNTVIIGEQCWMKENLRTTRFADGVTIALGTSSTTSAARYYPNNVAGNVTTYGYLYNWYAVMHGAASSAINPSGVRGICPTGWHVPSYAEWDQLTSYLQNHNAYICGGTSTYIAKALASRTGWNTYASACCVGNDPTTNNSTGFGAMPAGYNYGGSYYDFSSYAYYWSATQYNSNTNAYCRYLYYSYVSMYGSNSNKQSAYSVRCLRDQ